MTKRVHLISYYLTLDDARKALRQLNKTGFRDTALLFRSTTGKARTESITRQGWRYQVEPYVVAADVYRLPGREGTGGWT